MTMLLQEADQQYLRTQRGKQGSGKGKDEEKDEVLVIDQSKGKKEQDYSLINCWNCRDKDHFSSKCPKLKKVPGESKKPAENSSDSKIDSGPKTTSAVEEISDEEGTWAAYEIMDEIVSDKDWFEEAVSNDKMPGLIELSKSKDEDNVEMPGLEEVSDSEDEEEAMDLEEEDGMLELVELSDSDEEGDDRNLVEDMEILVVVKEIDRNKIEALNDASGEVFISTESIPATGTAKIYDSRCTNHISPYKAQFQNFKDITPRHFHAANKQSFSTIGKGDLIIDVPNGSETSQLRLTDILYLPEVSYMLVLIGRLDENGFSTTFGGGKCVLHGPDGVKVREVLRKSLRIYKVEHEEEVASTAEEKLTLEQFHQQMGHVSPEVARKLVKDGMVTGV